MARSRSPWQRPQQTDPGGRHMHKLLALLAVSAVGAVLAAPALGAGASVKVGDDYFKAKTVRIKKGSTVTWKWVGSDSHNVVGKTFKSKLQNKGTYKHKFSKAGTYKYICTLHVDKGMRGTIIVR
jgi:plastocyanin